MKKIHTPQFQLAKQIASLFASLSQVEAIALAGSCGSGPGKIDPASDIDLYVYTRGDIPLDARRSIAERSGGFTQSNFGLNYWGAGDLWVNSPTGIEMDIMYFDAMWMEDQILRVVERNQASLGYTTCFWYTVRQSIPFYDSGTWFANLQKRCSIEYPETLRRNIIRYNHPVLRGIITSYAAQIEKAVKRNDLVSINHRLAALFASYFDIIFAANRQLHPGEKRQVEFAVNNCPALPTDLQADITSILLLTTSDISALPSRIAGLLDRLDQMLKDAGIKC